MATRPDQLMIIVAELMKNAPASLSPNRLAQVQAIAAVRIRLSSPNDFVPHAYLEYGESYFDEMQPREMLRCGVSRFDLGHYMAIKTCQPKKW